MSKIAYEDKVTLHENGSIPDINKVKADDMNEIKTVVNGNDDNTTKNTNAIGTLSKLNTTDKINLVNAINETNNKFNYSTDEKVIGKDADGKPLYQKTITFNTTIQQNTITAIAHEIENAKNIFLDLRSSYMEANVGTANYISYNFPLIGYSGNLTDKVYCYADITNVNFFANSNWGSNWTKHIVLTYTKTTD
jgi:hypothetical protein